MGRSTIGDMQNRMLPKAIRIAFFFVLASLCISLIASRVPVSDAQSPPVSPPPPSGDTNQNGNTKGAANDFSPPVITILTTELKSGKNIVSATITDQSSLTTRIVEYVNQGSIKTADLARDQGSHYSALVDVKGPTAILVFEAVDANGNDAREAREFQVTGGSSSNFLQQFFDWLSGLFGSVFH